MSFSEGVRALLIDKDHQPQWQFKTVDDVPGEMAEAFLAPSARVQLGRKVHCFIYESFYRSYAKAKKWRMLVADWYSVINGDVWFVRAII
jgi:hypothetical protein